MQEIKKNPKYKNTNKLNQKHCEILCIWKMIHMYWEACTLV